MQLDYGRHATIAQIARSHAREAIFMTLIAGRGKTAFPEGL